MADPTLTRQYGNEGLGALRRFFAQLPQAATNWPRQAWDFGRLPADIAMAAIKQGRLGTLSPEEAKLDQSSQDAAYGAMMNGLPPAPHMTALPAAHGADRYARGAPERAAEQVAEFANPLFFGNPLRAIGSIPAALRHGAEEFAHSAAPAYVVKPRGGNWINDSVENALRGLKIGIPELMQHRMTPQEIADHMAIAGVDQRPSQAVNQWIDGPLTKYVKTRMASPDDEVRKLAEQGVLHFEPMISPMSVGVGVRRLRAGFPEEGLAQSNLAKQWEASADRVLSFDDASSLLKHPSGKSSPWLSNVAPDTRVFSWGGDTTTGATGFNHLIDELTNALNPASGLPAHLQLSPEAVKNMSMEKAVRRVADINDWRAANLAEHNRQLAEQASLVRDYPHSDAMPNPKGLRWVELKHDNVIPEGWSVEPVEQGFDVVNPEGQRLYAGRTQDDVNRIITGTLRARGQLPLADQLKYEGDTMGHCVGGYCDDVLSGRSRIFSLRDAKGEPHVTVEVDPSSVVGRAPKSDPLPRIAQIKGKQNKAPNDEYLPFVQDFVKNPPIEGVKAWGDVGDLQNTGLRRTIAAFNSNELKKIQDAGIEVPTYATTEEIKTIGKQVWPGDWGNYAQGGSVTQKESHPAIDIQGIMQQLREHHAHA